MDGKLDLFGAMARRMNWLGERQQVLAHNIANSDTPDYVPLDLKEAPFAKLLSRRLNPVQMAAVRPGHIDTPPPAGDAAFRSEEQRETYEVTASGNAVVLEEQLVKVQETQMDYQTMTSLSRKHMNMIRTALGV